MATEINFSIVEPLRLMATSAGVTRGDRGLSAYETWLLEGNTGSEQDFLDSLKGADGLDGANGLDGGDGLDGRNVPIGDYVYHAADAAIDTVGDWRQYADVNGFYTAICTVENATKGAGTWVIKQTITI